MPRRAQSCSKRHAAFAIRSALVRRLLVGPELNGVVGRKAASTNYPMYSDIMKTLGDFGVVWTEVNIDRWIANPKAVLPGAYMTMFPGVPDASNREDIIAYLKTFPPQ